MFCQTPKCATTKLGNISLLGHNFRIFAVSILGVGQTLGGTLAIVTELGLEAWSAKPFGPLTAQYTAQVHITAAPVIGLRSYFSTTLLLPTCNLKLRSL
jgi:hypothetical protein